MTATTQGKAKALAALAARRKRFKNAKSVDNGAAYAGSPMYFPCKACGDPQGVCVPESYLSKPDLCSECADLRSLGWLQ